MILLVLALYFRRVLCGSSEDTDASTTRIDIFERYAGNLIYNNTDGSCIACNGSCTEDNAVAPHSWTATLYTLGNVVLDEMCESYAMAVAEYGVVAFTWWEDEHKCSLHVTTSEYNISEYMVIHNGFDWIEEHPYNTGPLFLVRYPQDTDESTVDAQCYYGLNINQTPNIAREANQLIIATVVIIMIAWNGWMKHTDQYPDLVKRPTTDNNSDNENEPNIYDPASPKKDE